MKLLTLLALTLTILGSINAVPTDKRDLADDVKQAIAVLFEQIPETLVETNIPLTLVDSIFAKAEMLITVVSLSKLRDITIDDVSLDSNTTLNFKVHFDDIHFHFNRLFSFNILGLVKYDNHELDISADLENLSISGDVVFNDDKTEVTDVDFKLVLESSEWIFDRLLLSDELSEKVGTYLSTFVPDVLNTFFADTATEFNAALKQAINLLLAQVNGKY